MPKIPNWSRSSTEELEDDGWEFYREAVAVWSHDIREIVVVVNDISEEGYYARVLNDEEGHEFDHIKMTESPNNDGQYSSRDDAMDGAKRYMNKHPEPIVDGILDEIEYPDRDVERFEEIVYTFGGGSFSAMVLISEDDKEYIADFKSGAFYDSIKPFSRNKQERIVRTYLKVEKIVERKIYDRVTAYGLSAGSSPEDFSDEVEKESAEIERVLREEIDNKDIVRFEEYKR